MRKTLAWGAVLAAALQFGLGCTSSNDAAEGCATDIDCKGDRICVDRRCVDPTTGGAGTGGGTSSCLDNCLAAGGDARTCRSQCGGVGGAAGGTSTGGGPGVGGAPGTGGTGGGTGPGGTGGGTSGPMIACPYDQATAVFTLEEGPPSGPYDAAFFSNGALQTFDGQPCDIDTSMPGMAAGPTCFDVYTCGACTVRFDQGEDGRFTASISNCPSMGFFSVCTPDCTGKVCGSDGCGDVCGTCSPPNSCSGGQCRDICGDCVSDCLGLGIPGCCQCGPGCLCASECAPRCP